VAGAAARPVGLPWTALARPLGAAARARVAADLRALVRWQETLRGWPRLRAAVDATPFVSLYAGGRLLGCFGCAEGAPAERLARAFLRAMSDPRHGGVGAGDRGRVSAQVAWPIDLAPLSPGGAELEAGTHGVALARPGAAPVLLLPAVARDHGWSARDLLDALGRKAGGGPAALSEGRIYRFAAEEVVVHARGGGGAAGTGGAPLDRAARWIAVRVAEGGRVELAIDARSGAPADGGGMLHGRAAVAVQALKAHGGEARAARRAAGWIEAQIRAALAGRAVAGWHDDPPRIAGTLALAALAGIDVGRELAEWVRAHREVAGAPWHAAQAVAVLGREAPAPLWRACVADLAPRPWAPWTALAAAARGDRRTLARALGPLARSIRPDPPHAGGADVRPVPEVALTALAVEVLARCAPSSPAVARGRAFLSRWQLLPGRIDAGLDPRAAAGAFPASPVAGLLRVDITAHALLALL
jgi:AMMECR1 domain-containing protein